MAGEEIVQIGSGDLEGEVRRELDHHLGGERQRRYRRFLLAALGGVPSREAPRNSGRLRLAGVRSRQPSTFQKNLREMLKPRYQLWLEDPPRAI